MSLEDLSARLELMVMQFGMLSLADAAGAAAQLSSTMPIDGPLVRDVLADIWLTIPETARRVRQRIGTVLDYAHAKGWREAETPLRAILRGLPKQPKKRNHLAAMHWQDLPAFIDE